MEPAADSSPMETPTTKAPVRTIPTSVHVWLWIFISVWVISFLLPAVSIMEQRPGRGWEVAWSALVLFFVPVKGAWMIFIPGIWLVWMNLFMLIAPFELKQLEGGEGRIYAVLFSIGTAATIVIAYIPVVSGATGLRVGFYLWAGSLVATAGLFVRNLWQTRLANLPAACLMAALLALPVYRGEVDFLPSPRKPKPAVNQAAGPPARTTTTRLVDSSPNPSLVGKQVTFVALVSAVGGMPAGTVSFLEGKTLIGTAHTTTAGAATFSINVLKPGAHFITANFAGDAATNYIGSTSDGLIQMVNDPSDVETQTVLTVVERHQEQRADQLGFTVKAKVTASGSTAAVTTGEVTFVFMYAFRTARKLDGEGEATLSSVLPAAVWRGYQITAIYSGGNGLQSSVSTLTLQ
jgi:hypothetical protein